jgi:hypothetical protein
MMLLVMFLVWKLHAEVLVAHAEDAIINHSPLYVPMYAVSDRVAQISLCHVPGNGACATTMEFEAPRCLRCKSHGLTAATYVTAINE